MILGLLYLPDLDQTDPCLNQTLALIPSNVTRQANLPHNDFNIIALAPWISANCTRSYLASAHLDPIRAFIFYIPDNGTDQPPPISSPVWNMYDGGQWKSQAQYPVYAVPGSLGNQMMKQLSLYSGNLSTVPFGNTLKTDYQFDTRDYVRVYTSIEITAQSSLPALWVFLLIVVGGLLFVLASTSLLMHYIQRRRRERLRRRIVRGHVDLEALGIKRLTVPMPVIEEMPLFIYTCGADDASQGSKSSRSTHDGSGLVGETKGNGSIAATETFSAVSNSAPVFSSVNSTIAAHEYKEESQPTCPICLEDFESGSTVIRELPCGHIFHPECIDSFLSNNSSLCPMCKKSTLPLGYCPETITNAMVRRERAIRRLRSRVTVNQEGQDVEGGWTGRVRGWRQAAHRVIFGPEDQVLAAAPHYDFNMSARPRQADFDFNLRPRTIPVAISEAAGLETEPEPVVNVVRPEDLTLTISPGLSRHEIAQQRAPELLGNSVVMEEVDAPGEQRRAGCK